MTPLLRELRKLFPSAQIDLVTHSKFTALFENNPHLNEVILFKKGKHISGELSLFKTLTSNKYDLLIDAHGSLRSRIISYLLWIKRLGKLRIEWIKKRYRLRYFLIIIGKLSIERIKKRYRLRYFLVNKWGMKVINNCGGSSRAFIQKHYRPQREIFLEPLKKLDPHYVINTKNASTELFPTLEHVKKAEEVLGKYVDKKQRLIAISPSARHQLKEWGVDKYSQLIQQLPLQVHPIIIGLSKEKACQDLRSELPDCIFALDQDYLTVAAILKRCELTVANDSLISHISEAVGTPTVTIFGPTVKEFGFAPFLTNSILVESQLPCRPCTTTGKGLCENEQSLHGCMKECSVKQVLDEILKRVSVSTFD